jgi:WD40 repeat protein
LYKIKFNFEELNTSIKEKSIFVKIEKVYKYIENIYISSTEKIDKDKLFKKSFNINYTNIFKDKKNNKNKVIPKDYNEMNEKINKIKFELNQYKILNEHEGEIRNIISLNNGFFISSSLDGTLKLFNSLTGECFLSMSEPYGDQISQIIKLTPNKEINKLDNTYILLFSRHLIFIRINNDIFYNHELKDINELNNENNYIEIIQSIDNNGIYISQGIQLANSDIIAFNDNNEIKLYKLNPQTQTYLLHNYNINAKLTEFSSLLEIKQNIFAASSNEHLDNGENILKIFDLSNNNINENAIENINCSTGRDSLCMIQKNQILGIGLQLFNENKKNKNYTNGIAIVDINYYQVIQIIEDFRVHSLCMINFYVDYSLPNKDNIFKKEICFTKRKILAVAGYDQENEKRLIKFYEVIIEENENNNRYKFVNIIKRNEIISEHEGFINSIKWLKNGLLVTCSSDKMIFLYKHSNLDI